MHQRFTKLRRPAYTLLELMAAVLIIGLVATVGCPRATTGQTEAKSAACQTNRGDVEIQAELWRHNTGSFPATDLSDIGTSVHYFPSGLPACPVNGTSYTIDESGHVVGHNH